MKILRYFLLAVLGFGTAMAQIPTYQVLLKNDTLLTARIYEFDIYILRTGSVPFELATLQPILTFDSTISAGSITFTINASSSELNISQQPTTLSVAGQELNIQPRVPPGAGSGTIIPTAPGLRVGRFRLTSSVDFNNQPASIVWKNSGLNPVTKINAYDINGNDNITDTTGHLNQLRNAPLSLLQIQTASPLTNGTSGLAYTQTFTATGGTLPYVWALASGSLPPGLGLSAGGILSGTPTTSGTYNFSVRATDNLGITATQAYSLTIVPGSPARFQFIQQPTNSIWVDIIRPPVTVQVQDAAGNNVAVSSFGVSMSLLDGSALLGTLGQLTNSSGLATFNDLAPFLTGSHQLIAAGGGLIPDTSVAFTVTALTITASAGANGSVTPPGVTQLPFGGSQTYAISPNAGYHILNVLVDGGSVGTPSSYPFSNITTNHTISATFAIDTFAITASAGPNGTISPSGTVLKTSGSNQTFTITPNANFVIADVLVDGVSQGAIASYPFTNIVANHSITASFAPILRTVTIQSNPTGRTVLLDDTAQTTPHTVQWANGSIHTIASADTQAGAGGDRYIWTAWSDAGLRTHSVTITRDSTFTATYATQYFLTMVAGTGGTVSPSNGWHPAGQVVPISATPNATYAFGSWNGSGTGSYSGTNASTSVTMNGPISETASFVLAPVTVTIRTIPPGRSIVVDGTSFTSPQTFVWNQLTQHTIATTSPQSGPVNTQYVWNSWSDGGALSHLITATTDSTFIAAFTTQYLLTMTSDTSGTVSPASGYQDSGKVVAISATPSTGWAFASWTGTGTGSYSGTANPSNVTMRAPITEHAGFARFTAQVTIQSAPAGLSVTVDGVTYTSPHTFAWTTGSTHSISSPTPQSGGTNTRYSWNSWSDGGSLTHTVIPFGDSVITAQFTTQYFLTMNANTGGSVTPAGGGWYDRGQAVQITAIPNPDYGFSIWSGSGIGSYNGYDNPATVIMNGPISETANFQRSQIQIVIQANPPGRGFIYDGITYTTTQTRSVDPGTQHFLGVASPQPGPAGVQYAFASWSDGGDAFHNILPDTATTYTINFKTQFYLTMVAGSGGSVTPASGWLDSATTVPINATPNATYSFGGWNGTGTGSYSGKSNPTFVTMGSPITQTASFVLNPTRIVFNTNPPGRTYSVDGVPYNSAETFVWERFSQHSVATTSIETDSVNQTRYLWTGWNDNGALSHTVTAINDTTLIASFSIQYLLTMTADTGGTVSPPGGWQDSGKVVSVSANPATGFAFTGWTGSGSGSYTGSSASSTVTMRSPITEHASFGRFVARIVVQSSPPGLSIVVDETTYTSPQTFRWLTGTSHAVRTLSPQAGTAGQRFVWNSWSDGGAFSHIFIPTADTTLTAQFTTQYYLTTSANTGGTVLPAPGWFNSGQLVQISATPDPTYNFNVWSGTGNGSYNGSDNPASVIIAGPITETANFARKPVRLTIQTSPPGRAFVYNGQTFTTTQTRTVDPGTQQYLDVPTPQTDARPGVQYAWKNWSDGGAKARALVPYSDTTVIASFTTQFLLTTIADSGSVLPATSWQDSGAVIHLTGVPMSGFAFNGWTGTGTGSYSGTSNPVDVAMAGPITETASFGRFAASVTINSTPPGLTVIVDDTTRTTPHLFRWTTGTIHTLSTTTPQSGPAGVRYVWGDWSDGGLLSHTIVPISDTTIVAEFRTQYALTVSSSPSTGGNTNPSGQTFYNSGDTATVAAFPGSGYAFIRWTGSVPDTITAKANPIRIVMDSVKALTANFRSTIFVALQTSPPGKSVVIDTTTYITPAIVSWAVGSSHTISAPSPQPRGTLTREIWSAWSDSGAQTHAVTSSRDTLFTASFRTQFQISLVAGAGGQVTPPSGWFDSLSTVRIKAIPDAGFGFIDWRGAGPGSYTGSGDSVDLAITGWARDTANFGTLIPAPVLAGIADGATDQPITLVLRWNSTPGAPTYSVQVSSDSTFRTTAFDSSGITDTTVTVRGLANRTLYYWHVKVRDQQSISPFSAYWRFSTRKATFAVTTPSTVWATHFRYPITWSTADYSGRINIKVSLDGGTTYRAILTNIPNSGTFYWTIPDTQASFPSVRLRVESTTDDSAFAVSNIFQIASGTLPATVQVSASIPFPPEPISSTFYRLISSPGLADTLFQLRYILTGTYQTDWRAFLDNGLPNNYLVELTPSSRLSTGRGCWLLKKDNLAVSTIMTMPPLDTLGATYSIPLQPGWNIIGNTFDKPVPWSSVLRANGLAPSIVLSDYQGQYQSASQMEIFKGYYFFNNTGLFSLKIPYPFGVTSSAAAAAAIDWKIRVRYTSDLNSDEENYIGIAPGTKAGYDDLDVRKPPVFLDQGFVSFTRPMWDEKYPRFSSDFRPALGDGQVWDFEVTCTPGRKGTVTFDDLDKVPSGSSIVLINTHNSAPIDLHKSTSYTFTAAAASTPFKLIVGTAAFVAREVAKEMPTEFALLQNYPNPFNMTTSITVKLPATSHIRLDIYSILGQRVRTLADDVYPAGTHSFVWQGTDEAGSTVASGVYLYRLVEEDKVIQTHKMILAK